MRQYVTIILSTEDIFCTFGLRNKNEVLFGLLAWRISRLRLQREGQVMDMQRQCIHTYTVFDTVASQNHFVLRKKSQSALEIVRIVINSLL